MDLRILGIGLLVTGLLLPACDASGQDPAVPPLPGIMPVSAGTLKAAPTATPVLAAAPQVAATVRSPAVSPLQPMGIELAFPNLIFRRLTNLVQPDDGEDRIFVTEQGGRVLLFPNLQEAAESQVFLDISGRVRVKDNEEGLLGLAFDPGFRETGQFYVYYSASDPRRSVISRFSVTADQAGRADPDTELIIMEIPQPYGNHNGGQLAFGPDGYLYIGLGDGGLGGDPHGNGQDPGTLLGSILRIDVTGASARQGYRIPSDNPFAGADGARREVWAYGLRNPWRFSFDPQDALIWAGDVGQNAWEEIDLVEKGRNYGWNVMEGAHCFSPRTGCDMTGLELPLTEYSSAEGCSVIGGYVYQGSRLPGLIGAYVYGDFCSGSIMGLRHEGPAVTENVLLVDSGILITSFGRDRAGNLYILSRDSGIYRLKADQ